MPEKIKVGETYIVRVRVIQIEPNRIVCQPLNQDGTPFNSCHNYFNFAEAEAFCPANSTENAKPALKAEPTAELFAPIKKLEKLPQNFPFPERTQGTAQNTPKYDPCRRFKEGDIVDYRRVHGRDYETVPDPEDYEFARVVADENDESGMVWVEFIAEYGGDDACYEVPWFHLVLVTPVEELGPYCVRKYSSFYAVERYDNHKARLATFDIDFHPHAKAAAEAERDRLNAEFRKDYEEAKSHV